MTGSVTAFYLFDVAQEIRLDAVRTALGARVADASLSGKSGQTKLRYIQPPLVADGNAFGSAELEGFRTRFKFYDYGVVSVMFTREFRGTWHDLTALGHDLVESEPLERAAAAACRRAVDVIQAALVDARSQWLHEDYLVFGITSLDDSATIEETVAAHGADIAQLLRGERQTLSAQERDEVLRHRMSYLADDLFVPAWNAAFVVDTPAGLDAVLEILEFANSQLLEFRYHDEQLEVHRTRIHADLQRRRGFDHWTGRRYRRAARGIHALIIEVNELTDHVQNAVKFVGDFYAARLFALVAARLRLDDLKHNVQEKLKTLDGINRSAVEQTGIAHGTILELAIVLMMVIELGMFLAGWMK